MILQKPFTPLRAEETDDGVRISVYGRTYTASSKSPFASINSKGLELLYAPMRFVLREDGNDAIVDGGFTHFLMEGASDTEADILSTAESDQFILNLATHVEFDGCCDVSLTIAPRGRTVAQCYGMEAMKPYKYHLDRLWIEIPLTKEAARYYQFYPTLKDSDVLNSGGELSSSMALPHREQVMLTGEKAGLLFCSDSENGWLPLGRDNAIELLPNEDGAILRIRLIDTEPPAWRDATIYRFDLDPLTFRFGLMATPVKPMPEHPFAERAVHIDCYKKIPEDYCDFLASPFGDTGVITYDRLKDLGVNTLYIHEKWNDLQNSTRLTTKTARRLRTIIKECHERDIRVIPYFGYEMSTLAPYYREDHEESWRFDGPLGRAGWYRQPAQRNTRICQNSDYAKRFASEIDRLMTEYGFDGVYLDGTAHVWPCENGMHGCGFTDENGVRHETYPVWATRERMKALAEVVCEKHGGIINCHALSAFNLPALSFTTSLWDGEIFQWGFLHGKINSLPDGYFRALYTGRNIGIPIFLLTYLNPPLWDFHMALSTALPFGILPKVNDAGEPLEMISKIWKIFDNFGVEDAEWLPYYGKEHPVKANTEKAKISTWKKDGRLLVVVASTDRDADISLSLSFEQMKIRDAMKDEIISTDGKATLSLHGFDFYLIEAE